MIRGLWECCGVANCNSRERGRDCAIVVSALKVYADALRTRRRLRAGAAAGKARIKTLLPFVLLILSALFVTTLVPGLLSVLRGLKGGIGALTPRPGDT